MKTLTLNQKYKVNKKIKTALALSLAGILSGLSVACNGDKDLDTYRLGLANQFQAKAARINGTYGGTVLSKVDGAAIGSMQMSLVASSELQPSQDGLSTEPKSVIKGVITYQGLENSTVSFDQGFYDPNSNAFQATVPVTNESGTIVNLQLKGTIVNGVFSGDVVNNNYPTFGGSMSLVLNAPTSTVTLDKNSSRINLLRGDNSSYAGKFDMVSGIDGKKRAFTFNLNLSENQQNSQLPFLHLFSPQRVLIATISLVSFDGAIGPITIQAATVDDSTGFLQGTYTQNQTNASVTYNLQCAKANIAGGGGKYAWNCKLLGMIPTSVGANGAVTLNPIDNNGIRN